jgi:hypothetical protein
MGNNSFAPIVGHSTAVISLNGKKILIRECLHVPDLRNPLYSLWAHQWQRGCGFIGMYGLGMHVFFPLFIMEIDTATDCHLRYEPIGWDCRLADLNYVQPKYITDTSASATAPIPSSQPPATIEPDDDPADLPTFAFHWPKHPPSPRHPPLDMSLLPPSTYTKSLADLDRNELIQRLYLVEQNKWAPTKEKGKSTTPLDCMNQDKIITLLHHPNMTPPAICPCDTPNASDTKSHWTAEELHRITWCWHFWNYWHSISTTKDGSFINNGKFPVSIGAYTTIPKAPHSKLIDQTPSKYLDIVHLDIAFGNCMSIGGFKYALIFVDRTTRYNWCFGLKLLHHNDIIAAFMTFCAEAGNLAR